MEPCQLTAGGLYVMNIINCGSVMPNILQNRYLKKKQVLCNNKIMNLKNSNTKIYQNT